MKRYAVEFEIAGPAAMFSRPDTGAAPISYPVPTWSACKAMFESVARGFMAKNVASAFFCPTSVEIRRPVRFERYVTNYRGPLRKSDQIKKKASYQLQTTIFVDVCYRVRGETVQIPGATGGGVNGAHALQEMFNRRLAKGASKYSPCLGWKEFCPATLARFGRARNGRRYSPFRAKRQGSCRRSYSRFGMHPSMASTTLFSGNCRSRVERCASRTSR